jgi:cob(I)alamin adenosyltransferase
MKIYTKTGDSGETGLFGGGRIEKHSQRIEACGTVDELNSLLGLVLAEHLPEPITGLLLRLQADLFSVGAEMASTGSEVARTSIISQSHVISLEDEIDSYERGLTELKHFILPGGSRAAAMLHLARTVCRRAERRVVALSRLSRESVSSVLLAYLNRLSDLMFVLARYVNAHFGVPETQWPIHSVDGIDTKPEK